MIKILKYSFFTLLISLKSYSQNSLNGKIIYKASFQYEKLLKVINEAETTEITKNILRKSIKKTSDIKYTLKFNSVESIFSKEKKLESRKKNITDVLAAAEGFFYTNNLEEVILNQKESFGNQFLINLPKAVWILSQETKIIGKFTCYKATTIKEEEGRNGKFITEVVAWYTDSIPLNFGPKNYNGLPGMILELEEGEFLFSAEFINLNLEQVKISRPNKGKKIDLLEYNLLVKNLVKSRRNE